MEFLREHWYIVLGALAVMFLLARKGSGVNVSQIGSSGDTAALAQIAVTERDADETRRYNAANSLMSYDLELRRLASQDSLARIGLGQQLDLARISLDAQVRAGVNQFQLAQLQAQTQLSQYAQQDALQRYALQQASDLQRRNDWLGAITSGIQAIVPNIFAQSTNNQGGIFGGGIFSGSSRGGIVWH